MTGVASSLRRAALPTVLLACVAATQASAAQAQVPEGAVGGISSPLTGLLHLTLDARDSEPGLLSATATLEGASPVSVSFGGERCARLAAEAQAGEPIEASLEGACPEVVSGVALSIDTKGLAYGSHTLSVSVTGASGQSAVVLERSVVYEAPPTPPPASVTISLGDGESGSESGGTSSGSTGRGETLSYKSKEAPVCASPRLSMVLSQRPLGVSHGIVVLRYDRAYRYRGHLTCEESGARRRATAGTVIAVTYRIGKRKIVHHATVVGKHGSISVLLACRSRRTVVFKVAGSSQRGAVVRIPVLVKRLRGRHA